MMLILHNAGQFTILITLFDVVCALLLEIALAKLSFLMIETFLASIFRET